MGQFLHPSPVQSSRSIQHIDSRIDRKQVLCWEFRMRNQIMLYRSRNSGRDFWWNQLLCGPVLTPISCTKLKIHSAHVGSPVVLKQVLEFGTSLCFTDQETQEETFGGTSSLMGQFLHPSSVQSSRSIQRMQTGQLFPKFNMKCSLFLLCQRFGMLDHVGSMLHRSKNSGKHFFGGTRSLAGQFLYPSPLQINFMRHYM